MRKVKKRLKIAIEHLNKDLNCINTKIQISGSELPIGEYTALTLKRKTLEDKRDLLIRIFG